MSSNYGGQLRLAIWLLGRLRHTLFILLFVDELCAENKYYYYYYYYYYYCNTRLTPIQRNILERFRITDFVIGWSPQLNEHLNGRLNRWVLVRGGTENHRKLTHDQTTI